MEAYLSGLSMLSAKPYPLIGLIGVCLAVPLSPVAGESAPLSLRSAIETALEQNLGLRIASFGPAIAEDGVTIEDARFDVELFGSAALQERRAAAANSTLDSAAAPQNENRSARVGLEKQVSTGAALTIDSSIGRNTSNNNAARNPDYGTALGLSLRQPLLRGAGPRINLAPLARAKANAERSLFELRSEILDLILETEIAYWNLAYARADRALIASSLALAENLVEENEERERLGLVTPLEVLQAEAEVLNQQEAIIQAERAIEDARDALLRAMGEADFISGPEPGAGPAVAGLPRQLEPLRPVSQVVEDTVRFDEEAQAQELAIEIERINRMLAEDAARPELDLIGGVDYLGRATDGPTAYRGAYRADGYDWNVGLELRLPWGLREARARARQAERELEASRLQLYDIKQAKALAARNAWRQADAGRKRIEVSRAAVRLNEEAFEQERARYGSGLVAYRSVLEAQRDFDRARSNYLRAIIETLRATVRLSRVDGTLLSRNGLEWETVAAYTEVPGSGATITDPSRPGDSTHP
jgi:outer membrane protein TolC